MGALFVFLKQGREGFSHLNLHLQGYSAILCEVIIFDIRNIVFCQFSVNIDEALIYVL